MPVSEVEHPLNPICEEWLRKIEIAKKVKWEVFGQYAQEISKFYDGPHDWMWKEEYSTGTNGFLDKDGSSHLPTFRVTINKPFEAVALFGPALMHRYPQVLVTPVSPPVAGPEILGTMFEDPNYQEYLYGEQYARSVRDSCAKLKEHYLNWLQVEADKKTSARRAIGEAIIKGMGVMWCEMFQPRGSEIRYPRTRFVSVDDILKDPDAQYAEDVQWVARKRCEPVNLVARKFGLDEKELKGHIQSYASQATGIGRKEHDRKKQQGTNAQSYDLIEYWEIYSKNGFGHRLKKTKTSENKYNFDFFGDNTYIVVAKNIPYPLNFPSYSLAEDPESQFMRAQWPIPFWTDEGCSNGWPFVELHFYDKMNCVWPMSMLKPAIGELRFVNWCMSFLADKVAASSTTYIGVAKMAGMEIQNQLQKGLAPFTVVEIADIMGRSIRDVVSYLEAPSFSLDVWKMVSEVMELIDKRTGLTELIYGLTGQQMRSATEADIRNSNLSIRPDDMAERTEDFYSQTAMKEMEAAVWGLTGDDVRGVLGDTGAAIFETTIQGKMFETVVRDFNYRIASGSARKPNKSNRLRSLNEFGQHALPVMQQFAMQGMLEPWNAYVEEIAKALDIEDVEKFKVNMPPPQEQGPDPEEVEHEAEIEREEESHLQELRHTEEQHQQKLAFMERENVVKLAAARAKSNGSSR